VARVAGVGDHAVLLHGVDQVREIADHESLLKADVFPSVRIKTARSTGLFLGTLPRVRLLARQCRRTLPK
ncbi:MAG: hypothetical protein AB1418_05410, partial [Pseudomonadota bacterium]